MKNEKVQELIQQLDQGIKEMISSGNIKEYLDFISSFYTYSFNNQILIFVQNPKATLVQGFNEWKKQGRFVKKGETAIKILAPNIGKKKIKNEETGEDEEKKVITGFRLVNVFDVSQTEGKPLPSLNIDFERKGDSKEAYELYDKLLEIIEIPVCEDVTEKGCKGFYHRGTNDITLSSTEITGMDDKVTTLIHEYAHSILHHKDSIHLQNTRGVREAQAESISYIVAKYFGIDTSDFSFGYIASWSQEIEIIKQIGNEVQQVSSQIIKAIERIKTTTNEQIAS